jgi:hypoxanthine phosphoribosyltransferase
MDAQAGLRCVIQAKEINAAVVRLASEITRDYREKNPVLIGILKGSFIFMADLVRHLDFPLELEFVQLSSYGDSRKTSGRVEVKLDINTDVRNRDIIIVEDIVDTGLTLSFLLDYLKNKEPASIKLCALTEKPSRRQVPVDIDYIGFTVPDKFLVGYGLDCAGKYRNLPDICTLDG